MSSGEAPVEIVPYDPSWSGLFNDESDAMDIQTAEALDTLRSDVYQLRSELRGVDSSLAARIDGVESSLTARTDGLESSLRAEMRELHADARQHTDVVTESLRDDIRMVAEAVVSVSAKVDTLSAKVDTLRR